MKNYVNIKIVRSKKTLIIQPQKNFKFHLLKDNEYGETFHIC